MNSWNLLNRYRERGAFAYIDLAFAKSVLKEKHENENHAAILAVLFALSRQGHLALDLSPGPLTAALQGLGISNPDPLASLIQGGAVTFVSPFIRRFETLLYLQKNWVFETQILTELQRLHQHHPFIELAFAGVNPKLNAEQKLAVAKAMAHSLSLLTGGPGTGKTFTAAEFVKAALAALPSEKREQFRILLTAPTGKAVAQLERNLRASLEESSCICSGTLHAVLGIRENEREEEEESRLFADLIIVDECSMIDARIFSRFLASVPSGTRLLLIGDKNQLPPIEAGSIFTDLIEAKIYPCVHLTECLRSDRAEILNFAEQIKRGNSDTAIECLKNSRELEWTDLTEKNINLADLWEQCKDRFATHEFEKPSPEQLLSRIGSFSLLSSMRKGPLGVDAINRYFLYQSIKVVPEGTWWTVPIMISRNDYDSELYNGDQGFLVRKRGHDFSLRRLSLEDYALFRGRDGKVRQFSALSLPSFEYSYCLSVHKSQGSEYDEILILIPPGSELFGREAIYTAVTRARHKVFLIGGLERLAQSISASSKKISGLVQRSKYKAE